MNTAAYLTKQGWRGEGHSLDGTNRGLAKPLLVAHKYDNVGLGKKKADHDFSNQWWLNAWNTGTPAAQPQSAHSTTGLGLLQKAGLYSHFVKGQVLESTFDMAKHEAAAAAAALQSSIVTDHAKPSNGEGNKKRKHRADDNDTIGNEADESTGKKTKKEKKANANGEHMTHPNDQLGDIMAAQELAPTGVKVKRSKKLPREIRAERKIKKAETARTNAQRNRIEEVEIRKELAQKEGVDVEDNDWHTSEDEDSDDDGEPEGPAHAESIAGLRAAGQHVRLPLLPEKLPKDSQDLFYRAYEAARKQAISDGRSKLVLPFVNDYTAHYGPTVAEANKKSYKGDKIERESLKRQANREYRHWRDEVFIKDWLYKPDGMPVDGSDVNIEHGKKKKKKDEGKTSKKPKEKVDHANLNEERSARRAARAERREKMRSIKKEARAERKRRNEIKQVELRRAAEERRKDAQRQLDVVEAAKQGMDYEDFVQKKLGDIMQKKISNSQKKKAKAQAKADIMRTRQEQMLASGEHNGLPVTLPTLPPIDGVEKNSKKKKKSGSARKGSDYIALDADASDDDTDDASSVSDDHDGDVGDQKVSLPVPVSAGGVAVEEPFEALGFVVDTVGTRPNGTAPVMSAAAAGQIPKKKVKDMTKEERKARLEQMRARRAERRALQGKDPASKKNKQMSRAERKERMINKLTSEILLKKRQLQPDLNAPEVRAMSKKEAKTLPPEAQGWTRDDWKSARREARRFQRAVKAGKVPEHEVPLGWTGTVRSQPKRKGNGGRDPARPFWHEWSQGGERIDLRDGMGGA